MNIYEKHPNTDAYRVRDSFEPYAIVAVDKRFTDGEMAAELYKAMTDFHGATQMHLLFEDDQTEQAASDARDWMYAMERFATLPHFDEMSE